MINFTRAFDSAWERMVVILFRPFDLAKWFAIGFSAFLAGLLNGGNGFSSYYNAQNQDRNNHNHAFWQAPLPGPAHEVARAVPDGAAGSWEHLTGLGLPFAQALPSLDPHLFVSKLSGLMVGWQVGMIVLFALAIFVIVMAIVLLMYWLGAHGQFLFLDNIVRNRGAISWPWSHYSRQANSLFGIYLLFIAVSFVVIAPFLVVAIVMGLPLFRQHRWPEGAEIAGFVVLGLAYLVVLIVLSFVLFIFREFGVPLMFRNGLMARPAFMASMSLIGQHPGSVVIFVLLRIALAIAVAVISILACCVCCIGIIPYIGTVAILPALIYVRCFTLDCLAQFGPQYDAWTVDVPPAMPMGTPPIPPPRLG